MSELEQFRDDPLQPEFRETIRPLTLAEMERLTGLAEGEENLANRVKKRLPSNIVGEVGFSAVAGMVITMIAAIPFLMLSGVFWERWWPGRPMTDSEERLVFFIPLLLGALGGAAYSLTREQRQRKWHRERARAYRGALQRGLVSVITIRSVRCCYDFSERQDGAIFSSGRIVYELPSGRLFAVDEFSPPDEGTYARSIVQFRVLPNCPRVFEAVSSGVGIDAEIHQPGTLPSRLRKLPVDRVVDADRLR